MLIKYYAQDGSVYLIDGVSDVRIPSTPNIDDYKQEAWKEFEFDDYDTRRVKGGTNEGTHRVVITFAKDGPCALHVYGTAYICNDDGKTLEKVCYNE